MPGEAPTAPSVPIRKGANVRPVVHNASWARTGFDASELQQLLKGKGTNTSASVAKGPATSRQKGKRPARASRNHKGRPAAASEEEAGSSDDSESSHFTVDSDSSDAEVDELDEEEYEVDVAWLTSDMRGIPDEDGMMTAEELEMDRSIVDALAQLSAEERRVHLYRFAHMDVEERELLNSRAQMVTARNARQKLKPLPVPLYLNAAHDKSPSVRAHRKRSPAVPVRKSARLNGVIAPAPAATSTPAPAMTSSPAPAATSTPAPAATSTPAPAATSTPAPAMTSSPAPAATSTPAPAATSTPAPAMTSSPAPATTSSPAPAATSTPAFAATSTPAPAATSSPAPAATSSPAPAATSSPAPATTSTPAPAPATTSSPAPAATSGLEPAPPATSTSAAATPALLRNGATAASTSTSAPAMSMFTPTKAAPAASVMSIPVAQDKSAVVVLNTSTLAVAAASTPPAPATSSMRTIPAVPASTAPLTPTRSASAPRTSQSPVIPSAVTTPTAVPDVVMIDDDGWPDWLREAFVFMEDKALGDDFRRAMEWWSVLERGYGFETSAKGLPTEHRPPEVQHWLRVNRRVLNKPPTIQDFEGYGAKWWRWWSSMQPEWRARDPDGRPIIGGNGDWSDLKNPGKNGFLIVLISLVWWREGISTSEAGEWRTAVNDVAWVISSMAAMNWEVSRKRPADEPTSRTPKRLRK